MSKLLIVVMGTALLALPAREEVSREFARKATLAAGQRVSVVSKHGDVVIRGVTGNEASVRAFLRVSATERAVAEQFAQAVRVEIVNRAEELRVAVRYPDMPRVGGGAPLRTKFGPLEASGVKKSVSATNDNGAITLGKRAGR